MFDLSFINFIPVGFWFGLGLIQAVFVALVVFKIVSFIVDKVFDLFSACESLKDYTFTNLPDWYERMVVTYSDERTRLVAAAHYRKGDEVVSMCISTHINEEQDLKTNAENIQLKLMAKVAEEYNQWLKSQ